MVTVTISVNSVTISLDNKYIVSGSWDETIKICELWKWIRKLRHYLVTSDFVNSVSISSDSNVVSVVFRKCRSKLFKIWKLRKWIKKLRHWMVTVKV